jgi:sugar lactone lactonase YvrE
MYATNSGSDSLYTMDLATGLVTLVGPLLGPTNPNGLAFHPGSGTLFLVDNSTDTFYSLNTATGAAVPIGSTGPGNLLGLAFIDGQVPVGLAGFAVE